MISRFRGVLLTGLLLLASACTTSTSSSNNQAPGVSAGSLSAIPYGANPAASGTFEHNGVALYYETYGEGSPLLVIHGNGARIGSMAAQIEHFRHHYRVIAMDSRDHGRSADSVGPLTYEVMTDDLAALIEHLRLDPVDVIGWSDGGIEALLLAARHPDKVKKIVSMAPNLSPGPGVFYKETEELLKASLGSNTTETRKTAAGRRAEKVASLVLEEPNIDPELLEQITAPTLILAGDHDMVRIEHVVEIFNRLPNGQLGILPDSTHMVPYDNPRLFNDTAGKFLGNAFTKRDRIADFLTSYENLRAMIPE